MIDGIKDDYFLFTQVLLRRWHSGGMFANERYTNVANGKHTVPTSVVERAVDFDMIHVLGHIIFSAAFLPFGVEMFRYNTLRTIVILRFHTGTLPPASFGIITTLKECRVYSLDQADL